MIFKYKTTGQKYIVYIVLGVVFIIAGAILSIFSLLRKPANFNLSFITVIYNAVLMLVVGYNSFRFYKQNRSSQIEINDEGITYQKDADNMLHISWDEIETVEWKVKSKTNFPVITIKGKNTCITVGRQINDLPLFVQEIKRRVGGCFNTMEIPLEFKMKVK